MNNNGNRSLMIAATFFLVGLALLLNVIIWHPVINRYPLFYKGIASSAVEMQVAAISPSPPASQSVPEAVLREIAEDPRNLQDPGHPVEPLSPALQFLYTLSNQDVFPTQR